MPADGRPLGIRVGGASRRVGRAWPRDAVGSNERADALRVYFRAKTFAVNSPVGTLYVPSKRVFAPLRKASLLDCV